MLQFLTNFKSSGINIAREILEKFKNVEILAFENLKKEMKIPIEKYYAYQILLQNIFSNRFLFQVFIFGSSFT